MSLGLKKIQLYRNLRQVPKKKKIILDFPKNNFNLFFFNFSQKKRVEIGDFRPVFLEKSEFRGVKKLFQSSEFVFLTVLSLLYIPVRFEYFILKGQGEIEFKKRPKNRNF